MVSGNDTLRLLTYTFAEDLDDDGDGIPDEEDDDDDDDEGELWSKQLLLNYTHINLYSSRSPFPPHWYNLLGRCYHNA